MTRHPNKASVDAGTKDLNSDEPTPRTRKPNGETSVYQGSDGL